MKFIDAFHLATTLPFMPKILNYPIFEAQGLILAEDITASRAIPAFDNSAMDGYAILLQDYGKECICDGIILAGQDSSKLTLRPGHTYKVMTGAMLPQNTQAVVQIEWVSESSASKSSLDSEKSPDSESYKVQIPAPNITHAIKEGQNIRYQGEEIKSGEILLKKGVRLSHLDLSILASQGISSIKCYERLKISIYSSGDEVIEPGSVILPHQIYNTNATSLFTLLSLRYDCDYKGIISDNEASIRKALGEFEERDIIITSGGASVGDADLLKEALLNFGAEFLFDGLSVKPGRHIALARLKNTYIVLLPGNPLALLLHLHTLILPMLNALQGATLRYPRTFNAILDSDLKLKSNATNMMIGKVRNGRFIPHNGGKIGSSSLANMWQNDTIALFDGIAESKAGGEIKVISYTADFCDIMDFLNM